MMKRLTDEELLSMDKQAEEGTRSVAQVRRKAFDAHACHILQSLDAYERAEVDTLVGDVADMVDRILHTRYALLTEEVADPAIEAVRKMLISHDKDFAQKIVAAVDAARKANK